MGIERGGKRDKGWEERKWMGRERSDVKIEKGWEERRWNNKWGEK